MMSMRLVMIGGFPPPVGGAAKNNLLIYESLVALGLDVEKIDTAAKGYALHRRTFSFHIERIRRNLQAFFRARKLSHHSAVLYIVPDGGAGLYYSLAQIAGSAARYGRVVLHHRTYQYIDSPKYAMKMIVQLAPGKMVHVFLSDGMADEFQAKYGKVDYIVASNARFVEREASSAPQMRIAGPLRIGHLSNLCAEKGFFDVCAAFDLLRSSNLEVELHLAGPVIEPAVEVRLNSLLEQYGDAVKYVGKINGDAKRDFYRGLDLFLFPTRFRQEAAPNVVYEALAAGVPSLGTNKGCLAEMLPEPLGKVAENPEDFPSLVLDFVRSINPKSREEISREIKAYMVSHCNVSKIQYAQLLGILGADTGGHIAQDL
jgi:glycosyltransferase involved in cell wall biosynthesis